MIISLEILRDLSSWRLSRAERDPFPRLGRVSNLAHIFRPFRRLRSGRKDATFSGGREKMGRAVLSLIHQHHYHLVSDVLRGPGRPAAAQLFIVILWRIIETRKGIVASRRGRTSV